MMFSKNSRSKRLVSVASATERLFTQGEISSATPSVLKNAFQSLIVSFASKYSSETKMSSSIWFSMLIKGLNLAPKKRLDTALSLPSLVRIGKFVVHPEFGVINR